MPNSRRTKIRIATHEITIIRFGTSIRPSSVESSAEEPDVRAFEQGLLKLADESAVETEARTSGEEVTQTGESKVTGKGMDNESRNSRKT